MPLFRVRSHYQYVGYTQLLQQGNVSSRSVTRLVNSWEYLIDILIIWSLDVSATPCCCRYWFYH